MSLFAIADLHLSFALNKPMDKFGDNWENHHLKIQNNWLNTVTDNDTVMILGDISWALKENMAEPDLIFIKNLPGKKILLKGNHDYWWDKIGFLNQKYSENMFFMQNNFTNYEDIAIVGTRGWLCPNDKNWTEHDLKMYERESQRLLMSFEMARADGFKEFIVIMHYPPTNDKKEPSAFTDIISSYNVKKVLYGHLHGENSFNASLKGIYNNIEYSLVSADYVNFTPIKII